MLALNNPKELVWLKRKWGSWHHCVSRDCLSQPLDEIASYYGTQVGLYFAWLQFYTRFINCVYTLYYSIKNI